jgi:acetyl-CoA acetyltransferase
MGPVPASLGSGCCLSLDQIDVIELNEAFAAQSLGALRELGIADDDPREPQRWRNRDRSSLGMSGARILLTRRTSHARASGSLATMCIGVGQMAVIERVK